ncbi:C-C chemokine receptor type 8-like [Numida meleagris]|uniref:C-C chemokine receptor type 8-like n=1 Tax=Numida meleagris TaxID=8996 RepID=UPI000B3E0B2B|nr:C-C chemokine receptor type 8-like [Numida meleagris]
MDEDLRSLLAGGKQEDLQVDYQLSPAVNSSASYDNMYYPEQDIDCDFESIPAFASAFFPVLYSVLFVIGLMGNALVVWILTVFKKIRAMTDVYLLNLAISDLIFVFSLPFLAQYSLVSQWTFGNAMCKIVSSAYFIGFYSSAFFITIMSIDRYLAIVHSVYALQVRTTTHGIIASLALWAVAILASAPDLVFFQEVDVDNRTMCIPHYPGSGNGWKVFSNSEVNILGWLFPVSILVFCYYNILINLQRCRTQNKYKAMKLVFIVVIVFFLFWTPINIVLFLDSLRNLHIIDDCQTSQRLDLALELAETLSLVHCCLNPIIYAFVGEKFKKYLCEAFGKYAHFLSICKEHSAFNRRSTDRCTSLYTASSQSSFVGSVL